MSVGAELHPAIRIIAALKTLRPCLMVCACLRPIGLCAESFAVRLSERSSPIKVPPVQSIRLRHEPTEMTDSISGSVWGRRGERVDRRFARSRCLNGVEGQDWSFTGRPPRR